MTVFVDANVIVYAATDGPYHEQCADVLAAAADTLDARTSTGVLEEVWHIELSGRAGDIDGLTRRAHTLFSPLLAVTDEIFAAALGLHHAGLGANDRVHVATCTLNGIDAIVTADRAFDDVRGLRRVDPLDARAVSRLLSARS